MLQVGKSITSLQDPLIKIQPEYLYQSIKHPKEEIKSQIRQLRMVAALDRAQYNHLKKQLPYFVCGIFNPAYRKLSHFAYIDYFILDIDHIEEKGLNISNLRQRIQSDSRIFLSFISPGEDGLKLLFRLSERCFDAGIYSAFYKQFATQFGNQYHIDQVVDKQTSDVTRACFISIDPDVYYNPEASAIDISSIINISDPSSIFSVIHETKTSQSSNDKKKETGSISDDVLQQIKQRLNPVVKKTPPPVYVPHELEDTLLHIQSTLSEEGINITEVINIQYGKKIRAHLGNRKAETNIFYGRKGFSVVSSPRSGTDSELNDICLQLIVQALCL